MSFCFRNQNVGFIEPWGNVLKIFLNFYFLIIIVLFAIKLLHIETISCTHGLHRLGCLEQFL